MTEEPELKCQYCNKIFIRRSSLFNHIKKRTKGCLKIEEELKCKQIKQEEEDEKSLFQKLKNENQFLKFKLEAMEWKLEQTVTALERERAKEKVTVNNIVTNTNNTTNNNNRILNLTPMSLEADEFTKRIQDLFSEKYMLGGQEGIARFVAENLLTDEEGKLKYICTDPSRQIFKFMTDKGVGKDIKASKLTSAIYDEIKSQTANASNQLFDKSKTEDGETNMEVHDVVLKALTEITGMGNDNSDFSRELAKLTT